MTGTARTAPDIYSIPPGVSFADRLAGYVLQQTDGDPLKLSEYLILLPSRRSCRTVREAFLRLTDGKPMVLPRLQPLGDVDAEELAITLSGHDDSALDIPPAISPLRRQVVLAQTIMKLYEQILPAQQRPRFDQTTLLADELAALLDQVQTENLAFEQLNDLVPEEFSEHWQITLDFLKILTENWPAILDSYGAIDPAARRNQLLAAQAQLWRDQPPQFPVIAAGSIASIPATIELLDVIAGLPQGQIILPGLDTGLEDDAWQSIGADHPQYFLKKLLDALAVTRTDVRPLTETTPETPAPRQQLWSEALRPAATTDRWQRLHGAPLPPESVDGLSQITCKTPQDEAETIAIILREVLETPDKTAAVVTPDRALARRVSAALERWGIEADDSAGTDLHQTPKGNWALIAAEMVVDDFAPVALLTALRHPMTRLGQGAHYLAAQINRLEILGLRGPRPENGLNGLRRRI
ncbi:MAG: double-strand break repair protein AddB, partial [Pseudomonadota bacterium]